MLSISREYSFAAAHRLEGHPKCGRLHGHNYEVMVTVASLTGTVTDEGWIMDYAQLDAVAKPVVGELDHRYIVSQANLAACDPYAEIAQERGDAVVLHIPASTAEQLVQWIGAEVKVGLAYIDPNYANLDVTVTLKETAKSTATYHR